MTTTVDVTSRPRRRVTRRVAWAAAGVELMIALAAVYGGVGLIWGNRIGMLDEWLVGTPFRSWTLPGLLLLIVVAVPMLVAAWLELQAHPGAAVASIVAGSAQIGWIAAQLLIMQRYNVQQPLMLLAGLLVLLTSLWAHHPSDPAGPRWAVSRPRKKSAGAAPSRPRIVGSVHHPAGSAK